MNIIIWTFITKKKFLPFQMNIITIYISQFHPLYLLPFMSQLSNANLYTQRPRKRFSLCIEGAAIERERIETFTGRARITRRSRPLSGRGGGRRRGGGGRVAIWKFEHERWIFQSNTEYPSPRFTVRSVYAPPEGILKIQTTCRPVRGTKTGAKEGEEVARPPLFKLPSRPGLEYRFDEGARGNERFN